MSDDVVPLGTAFEAPVPPEDDDRYAASDGRWVTKADYPELWDLFQSADADFGHDEERFRLPDFRGRIDGEVATTTIYMKVKP